MTESKELEDQKGGDFSDKLLVEEAYESYYKAALKAAAREKQGKPPLNKSSWLSAIERFHGKYRIIDSSGCWEWKSKRIRNGVRNQMGSFFFNGIKIHANQASWILFRGAILKNMGVHHKCLLATCVNPDHLILMPHQESIRANAFTGRRKDLKELKEQLTTTQQALDSSCQTNQILVKRLKMADEGLRRIINYTLGDPTGGGTGIDLMQGLAKITLNAIEGK